MALGVRTLAMIWDAAWKAGRGAVNPGRIEPDELRGHYEDASFMRSVMIDEIEDEIADPARAGGPAGNRSRARDSGESGDDGSGEQAASVRSAAVQVRTRVKRSA